METRKVQVTGGSTFVVSLPKAWVRDVQLKPSDTLGFIEQHDGTLLLTPKIVEGREERSIAFDYSNDEDRDKIMRDLIGAYMMGYDLIEIGSKPRMPSEIRDTIRKFTQMVIGPEIIDETIGTVLTKDLLDPTDLSFKSSIKRMHRIVEEMHRSAMLALKEKDKTLALDVITRDDEVDRINWLVARQYNMLIRDIRLAERMETTRERSIYYLLISRIIERIGDHGVKISENVPRVSDSQISKKVMNDLTRLSDTSLDLLAESLSSLFKRDIVLSNDAIEKVNEFIVACDRYGNKLSTERGEGAIALGHILESIRRVAFYARDISECVINLLVDVQSSRVK